MQAETLTGKHVVILGLARQGTALAHFLAEAGAEVTVSDLQDEDALADRMEELASLDVRYVLGGHPLDLLDEVDLLCLSGGVPLDIPIVEEARRRGIPLSNDVQLFLERCPAPVIGITGSAGKTTTTALVREMLRAAGVGHSTSAHTWVGGNIGDPLIDKLHRIGPDDRVVMELSSFQLEIVTTSPHVAAVLNITPNHLDRHGTMEAYIAAKRNILSHQTREQVALLGYDDANARSLALETPAQLFFFSDGAEVERGAFKIGGQLTLRMDGSDREICRASEVRLLGDHNLLNVLAASTLAALVGTPVGAIRQVATTFAGVEHRLELVREWNGARWYDDSIATAPERSLAAMRSFDAPIVLLAGGRDKELPWDEFAEEVVRQVRQLVTFGEAGPMIARVVEGKMEGRRGKKGNEKGKEGREEPSSILRLEGITPAETLEEAVEAAARRARPGDVVLLSPGGTSFDAFQDFAERGDRFKELVQAL